jgi:hypothetical protein
MKGGVLARDFYPFVEESTTVTREQTPSKTQSVDEVNYPARIAIYDDAAAAPRVVVVEPSDPRSYLEEITATVNKLAHEQGGSIPFTVIREIVENFIHAYFIAPTISILDAGNTIRFSDQGPGIKEKTRALEYGTSSATEEMKHYIRGVGSGLPYAQQYMLDKGGSLEIEDNISSGTVVTISTHPSDEVKSFTRASVEPATEPALAAPPLSQASVAVQVTTPQPEAKLSERGQLVIDYLGSHEAVGPSDLSHAYGYSNPTWSRELGTLCSLGVLRKVGQKYRRI